MTAMSLALHHHLRSLAIVALAVVVVWLVCEVALDVEQRRDRRDFDDAHLRVRRAMSRKGAQR